MKKTLYKADTRGEADYGWLKTNYSFSFASWFNPERMNFGKLRVLNDDIIEGGQGFGTHPHENMEIITIPLEGQLEHKDSGGHKQIIHKDEVQIMSAGTGVFHSEYNASATESVSLLQIWILPKEMNIAPRYDQKSFDPEKRLNAFQPIVSSRKSDSTLWINQDAQLSLAEIEAGNTLTYNTVTEGSGMYFFVINGAAIIENEELSKRDALGISESNAIDVQATDKLELLVIEVPMN